MAFVNEELLLIYPNGWVYDGVQYPNRIFSEWSDEQLSSVGVYRVVYDEAPIPEGKMLDGWTYKIEGHVAIASPLYIDEVVVIPESVSKAQGKAALLAAGILDDCEGYIDTLEGDDKTLALLAFNETNEWRRDSPFLNQAATALGATQEQMDELFLEASKIAL